MATALVFGSVQNKGVYAYAVVFIDRAETIRRRAINLGAIVKLFTGDQLAIGKEAVRPLCVGTNMYPSSSSIVVFPGDQLEIENDSGHLLGMRTNMYLSDESIAALPVLELIEKANGFVGVFPESKYNIVKHLQGPKHKYEMTGHGNKVAFALKMTDIVADDAVRSVSDIVLTEPGLSVIISGRANFQRMNDNVLEFMLHVLKWKFDMPPLTHLIMAVPNDGVVLGAYRAMTLILVTRSRNLFFAERQGLLHVGVFLTSGIEVLEGRKESPGGSQWDFSVLKPPFDLPKHVIVEAISRALNLSACVRMNTVIGIGVAGATNIARSACDFWPMKKPGHGVVIRSLLSSRAIFQRLLVNTLVYTTSFTIWIVLDIMILALIWKFDYPPLMVLIIATSWTIMTPLLDSSKHIHNI